MLVLPFSQASADGEASPPLVLNRPDHRPEREPLRHLVLGSRVGVQATLNQLHACGYAERATWSQLIVIPPSGVLLTPQQGEVFSYLLRYRQRG